MRRVIKKGVLSKRSTPSIRNTAYVVCDVGSGMFSGEMIVSLVVKDESISVIVNDSDVSHGRLQVQVYDKKGDQYLIGLPGEAFSSSRKLWIGQNQLQLR